MKETILSKLRELWAIRRRCQQIRKQQTRRTKMKKSVLKIAMIALTGTNLWATDIGHHVERQINVSQRISVPVETEYELVALKLPLDRGEWEVDASLTIFLRTEQESWEGNQVYFAGCISPNAPRIAFNDGKTVIGSTTIWNGRSDPIIPLVGRAIQVDAPEGDIKWIYVMVWVHVRQQNPPLPSLNKIEVYGFANAHKIRDLRP